MFVEEKREDWVKQLKLFIKDFKEGYMCNRPMQETRVRSLVWEDQARYRAAKPTSTELRVWELQLLSPRTTTTEAHTPREPVLCNKRSHHDEKPAYAARE